MGGVQARTSRPGTHGVGAQGTTLKRLLPSSQ